MPHKGQKHKLHYTEEDMEKAIKKVRTRHLSYQQAHEIYGVPKSTVPSFSRNQRAYIQVVVEDGENWIWPN